MGLPNNRRPGPKPNPDRDTQALELRQKGLSYRAIQREMRYPSVSSAYDAVQRALASVRREPADALIRVESERLDRMTEVLEEVLARRLGTAGRSRDDDEDDDGRAGEANDELLLKTVDRYLRVQERRSKLLGLDAPTRHEISLDTIEAEIARLEREAQQ
jgi:hypothetical protein